MQDAYPKPKGNAALVLSFRLKHRTVLVLGSGALAASRVFAALEADSSVILLARGGIGATCDELKWRIEQRQVDFIDWDGLLGSSGANTDAETLDAFLKSKTKFSLAIITDTLSSEKRRSYSSAKELYGIFKARNIPVNTADIPDLCDFSFTSTHRFENHETGEKTTLQIGVTTNGLGCRIASRLRRDIVSKLPREIGAAVEKVGRMRSIAKDGTALQGVVSQQSVETPATNGDMAQKDVVGEIEYEEEISEENVILTPNRPVPSRSPTENAIESRSRQMKWVAQVSEYWPIPKLASLSDSDMHQILAGENVLPQTGSIQNGIQIPSKHFESLPKQGRILLVGSGPGHPSLLTIATHTALTQLADLVLSDKLVPDAVLALIPPHVQIRIARKFPGNAEGAQIEMMEAAVEAAQKGLTVLRLKQGDPVVYGRAGEEVLYFRAHGFEPLVIPGVSSALAAPTFAGIPITQRGAAESFIVCTGVGRKGKEVQLPGYERGRTLVILMGVARLSQVIAALTDTSQKNGRRDGSAYPTHLPIAIIERASMPDQRVISSTLKDVVRALESNGEQRPPGMMVIGWSVLALSGQGDVGVLDENADCDDEARVRRWLGDATIGWKVQEGLDEGWEIF